MKTIQDFLVERQQMTLQDEKKSLLPVLLDKGEVEILSTDVIVYVWKDKDGWNSKCNVDPAEFGPFETKEDAASEILDAALGLGQYQ